LHIVHDQDGSLHRAAALKGTADVADALCARQAGLAFCVLPASNEVGFEAPAESCCQQSRLVVTPSTLPFAMKGNSDDTSRPEGFALETAQKRSP
jgi:hypothetical protein